MDTIPLLLVLMLILHPNIAHGSENTSDLGKENKLETYIVHVSQPEGTTFAEKEELESWHRSFLPDTTTSLVNKQQLVYSYKNVMSGFAARLTEVDVKAIETKDGFLSARPERVLQLQTTHSPAFLGLHQQTGFWRDSNFGKGVIIGVLDSGVFPNHPSFSDEGMSPPPAKWKGRCEFNVTQCNNKLIGARVLHVAAKARKGMLAETPLDDDGHGTHTASTAGGNFVYNVDVLGNAKGTAIGIAPQAHLAIYRVCFPGGQTDCSESDILAGIETAIEDGVDVISISIGAASVPFFNDSMAIGLFAAIQKGVFVSCAAGNSGPVSSTISNEAPWILTVGASTMDRRIVASAKLGSGQYFDGESVFQPSNFPPTLLPLVYAGMNGTSASAVCGPGALNGTDVKGKVVLCDRGGGIGRIAKGQEVKNAGGAAMILANDKPNGFSTNADPHVLPATHVTFAAGEQIKSYINSTKYPMATIVFKGTVIGDGSSPAVASFSSRGPSTASPGILKPDIIGPGVGVLAAWPFPLNNNTKSTSTFNIMSGTSMSCPHLSGIAALLKSSHPHWSPAAIKSAIMTTADVLNTGGKLIVDQTLQPADVLATGAGHVNPSRANSPGLVYDIQPDDYIPFLCGLGYTDMQVSIIAHRLINCSEKPSIPEGQLNYPSFSVILGPQQTFTRTLTNVGDSYSTYYVKVVSPPGVYVSVKPSRLQFSELYQKETYSITFSKAAGGWKANSFAQGYIVWESTNTNTKYSVRSPISIRFK